MTGTKVKFDGDRVVVMNEALALLDEIYGLRQKAIANAEVTKTYQKALDERRAAVYADICAKRDDAGKPIYSNDKGRDEATIAQLANDETYGALNGELHMMMGLEAANKLALEHQLDRVKVLRAYLHGGGE